MLDLELVQELDVAADVALLAIPPLSLHVSSCSRSLLTKQLLVGVTDLFEDDVFPVLISFFHYLQKCLSHK